MTELFSLIIELFIRFFFVGLFSVGGGLATLPFLSDMGDVTGWFTQADISNMVAISESTPGPLGINMATYIGFKVLSGYGTGFGFLGGVLSTVGLVLPSLIVIMIVSKVLDRFRKSKYVEYAFYGLRAASLGLITAALLSVVKLAFFYSTEITCAEELLTAVNYKSIILSVLVFIAIKKFKKLHPIVLILLSALVGIIFKM